MTGVFAGPGLLVLFIVSAFFGALKQTPGAKEALQVEAPGSVIISMSSGGSSKPIQRSYLLVPASFKEQALFVATVDEWTQVNVTRSAASAFYTWAGAMAVAVALTFLVSVPVIWRLYRPHPALVTDQDQDPSLGEGEDETEDKNEHARL